ncbi:MFS transporter [Aliicoccus persicus]|uniref:Major Facilitator Superfamily protein n=1 Tax=Aliicoccus persicus TaxID=930138 RepID=A0A662Z4S2_9STAP|nr:MFS transporter [Aliicoccus persicus]SEV93881.1 Major Facilitator Superfamily protein [Aliicoccus persicus]
MIFDRNVPVQERVNFLFYILSRFILTAGNYIYLFAVSYFILYETGSAFYFSINLAISVVVSLILLPFAGLISDLGNKRKTIITGEWLFAGVIIGLFAYTQIVEVSLIAIYITTLLTSLISPFVSNTFQAAITEMFHKARIQKVMGYTQSILSAVPILGPVLGGVLFGLLGFQGIVIIFMIATIFSAAINLLVKFDLYYDKANYETDDESIDGAVNKFKRDVSQGFSFLFKSDVFKSILITVSLINIFVGPISVFPEIMMIVELGFEPETLGLVNALAGIGVLVAGVTIANMKSFKNPLLQVKFGIIILGTLYFIYALPIYIDMQVWMSFVYIACVGFTIIVTLQFINVPAGIFLQKCIPQHIKGRALSAFNMFAMSLSPIGTILYGVLYDTGMYATVNIVSGAALILVVVLTLRSTVIKRARDLNAQVDAEIEAAKEV